MRPVVVNFFAALPKNAILHGEFRTCTDGVREKTAGRKILPAVCRLSDTILHQIPRTPDARALLPACQSRIRSL